ncbi:MAG: aminotransferase DegT [Candidatus Wallbacteria bacterium HGW-Wallbacteria-1]|uniref:Aminotransferase DegT n=1 Tax=Candidatus Wallbacteria bacterium HGW-Wallbacteria-1 TaxID=2013854 RepID=A0A2N1PP47_9BACT|nr:MAG: aminotransferase DegT [Candidatus Wallbacteria bacterium HGW-Wallbacteria-1]
MENGPVGLHEPLFLDRESEYLSECLKTREVSSTGRFISEMENRLREITGCAGAILVGNGTVGLQVSLTAAGVGQGHEVLVPALTFVAAANAVVHCGATPHLVDVSEENLGVDAVRLEEYLAENCDLTENGARNRSTGRVIRALLVVHTFGHPPDMDALAQICRNWNMVMVEDGAEALGSTCRGRHCCTTGLVGIVSFNGNKIITTGGGGAVLTMDPQLATELRDLISTARIPHRWEIAHTTAAFNFRLPNLNAALGMAQLDRFEKILDVKRRLAAEYESHFSGYVGLKFLKEPEYARSNYWLNALILDREMASQRDEVLEKTNDSGFGTRPAWIPMHFLPMYSSVPRMDLRVTEDMAARIVNLPSGPGILWEK